MGSITSAQAQGTTSNNKRPNFLFILPDQHRFDWIGANPNLEVKTPNLDSLIARGTRFQQAFVPSPVCGPSRACLASGREYDRCGVGDNFTVYPTTQATYYEKLRDAGYYVGACGKLDLAKPTFDNGIDGRNHMSEWGFSDMVNCAGKGDAVLEWDKFKTPLNLTWLTCLSVVLQIFMLQISPLEEVDEQKVQKRTQKLTRHLLTMKTMLITGLDVLELK
nr:sulfatase-like hydrolase/transferase [Providencia sp. G1(2023)]